MGVKTKPKQNKKEGGGTNCPLKKTAISQLTVNYTEGFQCESFRAIHFRTGAHRLQLLFLNLEARKQWQAATNGEQATWKVGPTFHRRPHFNKCSKVWQNLQLTEMLRLRKWKQNLEFTNARLRETKQNKKGLEQDYSKRYSTLVTLFLALI